MEDSGESTQAKNMSSAPILDAADSAGDLVEPVQALSIKDSEEQIALPPVNEPSLSEPTAQDQNNPDLLVSMGILPPDDDVDETVGVCGNAQVHSEQNASDILHKVKIIKWKDIEVPIITQNNNGPCPLMAILNCLLLKGIITLPKDKKEFSGGELVTIIANTVVDMPHGSGPSDMDGQLEQNTNDAFSNLHKLLTGLDVNVKFSGVCDFEFTQELSVFDVLNISLYHGWVADPAWDCTEVVRDLSYNQLTNNIIMWQEQAEKDENSDASMKAVHGQEFLSISSAQLTVHGLFELSGKLIEEEVSILFRNNHFSTIYKKNGLLYVLLTDQGFLHEKAVWETLNDVDATFSTFVTGTLQTIEPTPEEARPPSRFEEHQINVDEELAAMLHAESVDVGEAAPTNDELFARELQERENEMAEEAHPPGQGGPQSPPQQTDKKKKDCVIL